MSYFLVVEMNTMLVFSSWHYKLFFYCTFKGKFWKVGIGHRRTVTKNGMSSVVHPFWATSPSCP